MPAILTTTIPVPESAIDANRHVNNLEYLRWMQEAAIGHSTACGWPMERYFELGATWVVRSHYIEYLRPALAGDELALHTWVAERGGRSSRRRFLFRRQRDGALIARAETLWVFADLRTGRGAEIPEELRSAFPIVASEEDALALLAAT
jgi:acyl-CoA thioester hydrolase